MTLSAFTYSAEPLFSVRSRHMGATHIFAGKNSSGEPPKAETHYAINGDRRAALHLKQVHGTAVKIIRTPSDIPESPAEADAAVTDCKDVYLTAKTADCVPILIDAGNAVAAIHAGWRGACRGVVASAVSELKKLSTQSADKWRAAIGPCIRRDNFEVKDDFLEQARSYIGGAVEKYLRVVPTDFGQNKYYFDVVQLVTDSLAHEGAGNIEDCGADCYPDGSGFYSHRRSTQRGEKRPSHNFAYIGI